MNNQSKKLLNIASPQQQKDQAHELQTEAIKQASTAAYELDEQLNNLNDTNGAWQCLSDLLHFSSEDPNTRELGVLMQILLDKQVEQTQMLGKNINQARGSLTAASTLNSIINS